MASIKKRPNGSWRARYRDADGKEHAKHFPRKIDAQSWLDEVTTAVRTGRYVDPAHDRETLAGYFEDYAPRQLWTMGTYKAMSLAMRDCTFSDVPFGKLRRSHVESWVRSMTDRLAPGTVRTRFNNVHTVVRGAVGDRRLPEDVMDRIKLPSTRAEKSHAPIPTPEDVGRLLNASESDIRAFWGLAAFAGLRLGEAAALRFADIDFLRRELHVRRQVQRAEAGNVEIRAPKYGSTRTVYIPAGLLELLAAHAEGAVHGAEEWLFLGSRGNPPHQNTVGYWWRQSLRDAGLSGFVLHDLRHFYASGLIAAGCDVVTVQRALGHSSPTVTLNTYSHLWPTAEDRTRAAAQGLFESSFGSLADSGRTASA
ncbi:tyrosine-type recombinase/integrase [Kocuria rosea]|uniref:tyrosine-type recombinase/integrase n=1 Tax=Kocuria rosea TaxID=1275 RepID=UPI000D64487B|nr:site-specific integrase [Kocuria rosea]PWF82016.1 site-specific integrase [Kocuria rosea]STX02590.1 site-specific tyrosine recombinase XerC [Kocuria rosea]